MSKWGSAKDWWMDLFKNALGFIFAGFLTLFVFTSISENRQKDYFKWQLQYSFKLSVINDFEKAAREYGLLCYDAVRDYVCGKNHRNSSYIRNWEGISKQTLNGCMSTLVFWLDIEKDQSLADLLEQFMKAREELEQLKLHAYLTDCEGKTGLADIYLESQWIEFDDSQITPKQSKFFELLYKVCQEAKYQISKM
jgi:hypothetical protein